jgi:hypothetical protein
MSQRTMAQMMRHAKLMMESSDAKMVQASNDLREAENTLDQIAMMVGILPENPPNDNPHASFTPAKHSDPLV